MILHGDNSSKPNIPGTFASPFDYIQNQKKAQELQTMDLQRKQQEQREQKTQDTSTNHLKEFDSQKNIYNRNSFFKK